MSETVESPDTGPPPGIRHWGVIDGVSIDFPMVVPRMNSATLTWSVPLLAAAELLPGEAFEVANMGDGSAMLIIALVDYIDNPWGNYDEVNFGLLVHPAGRPEEIGAFQWRMPVNQEMTCIAGNEVMGLPKTVEDLSVTYREDYATVELSMEGESALTVRIPRAEAIGDPVEATTLTYSYLDDVPMVIPLTIQLPTGMVDPVEVQVQLGAAPVADELLSLGLPRTPDLVMWGEGLSGTFGWPEPLS